MNINRFLYRYIYIHTHCRVDTLPPPPSSLSIDDNLPRPIDRISFPLPHRTTVIPFLWKQNARDFQKNHQFCASVFKLVWSHQGNSWKGHFSGHLVRTVASSLSTFSSASASSSSASPPEGVAKRCKTTHLEQLRQIPWKWALSRENLEP